MSWFGRTSRLDPKLAARMNVDFKKSNLSEWVNVPVCKQSADALNEWLPMALEQETPMMQELVDSLGGVAAAQHMPEISLNYDEVGRRLDISW